MLCHETHPKLPCVCTESGTKWLPYNSNPCKPNSRIPKEEKIGLYITVQPPLRARRRPPRGTLPVTNSIPLPSSSPVPVSWTLPSSSSLTLVSASLALLLLRLELQPWPRPPTSSLATIHSAHLDSSRAAAPHLPLVHLL